MRRIRFLVAGRVQGVAFRAATESAARRLGLVGFVRNRRDGKVEGEAEGPDAALTEFATWLWKGSPWSRVDEVQVDDLPVAGSDTVFDVRH